MVHFEYDLEKIELSTKQKTKFTYKEICACASTKKKRKKE